MADIVITAANVVKGANAKTETGILGAVVTAGQIVYKDTTDSNKFKLADCDNASSLIRTPYGIALNGGAVGQTVTVHTEGEITIGGVLVAGKVYTLSDVAGALRPEADNAAGDYTAIIGIAKTTAILDVKIFAPGYVI